MEALMTWRAAAANAGPDVAAIENDLLTALGELEWPRETNIAIDLRSNRLLLDVDLPEIEDMPATRWTPNNRSEEHTSELQSLMRISYAVFCLKKKNKQKINTTVK